MKNIWAIKDISVACQNPSLVMAKEVTFIKNIWKRYVCTSLHPRINQKFFVWEQKPGFTEKRFDWYLAKMCIFIGLWVIINSYFN